MTRWIVLALALLMWANPAEAQERYGWVNIDYILANSSMYRAAQTQLQQIRQETQDTLMARSREFQAQVAAVEAAAEARGEPAMQALRQDSVATRLQLLQERLMEIEQSGQRFVAQSEQQILAQVFAAVQTAIDAVAAREGYAWVFSNGGGATAMVVAPDAANVSDAVLRELGDTPPAVPPPGDL